METITSQFRKWKAGEMNMLGSFQTALFHAFQLADSENQEKLSKAFPYWFSESGLNNGNITKSTHIDSELKRITNEVIVEIKTFLDKNGSLEFEDTVNMSYADEEMRMIAKEDGKYLLMSIDNKSGSEYYTYELNDEGSILIEDLIWILEQIEDEKGL